MLRSDFIPWLLYTLAPQAVFQANGVSRSLLGRIKDDREKMRLLDALQRTTGPSTLRRDGMSNDMRQLTSSPIYPIEEISVPTLIIHAANDPIIPFESAEFSARTIPNSQFLRLERKPTAGKLSEKERPQLRKVVLLYFQESCASSAAVPWQRRET